MIKFNTLDTKYKILFSFLIIIMVGLSVSFFKVWSDYDNAYISNQNTLQISETIINRMKSKDFSNLQKLHCTPDIKEQEQNDYDYYYEEFVNKIKNINFASLKTQSIVNEDLVLSFKNNSDQERKIQFKIKTEPKNLWKLKSREHKCFTVDTYLDLSK